MLSRRYYLLFLIFFASCSVSRTQNSAQPNIVFIVVDDLNDYVGFLGGHPQVSTPNLDALAAQSIVFENAFCSATVCAPSRTSFLSGKDLYYTQVYNNVQIDTIFRNNFDAANGNGEVITLPEHLKNNGYYTIGINKVFDSPGVDFDVSTDEPCEKSLSWNEYMSINDGGSILQILDSLNQGFHTSSLHWGILPDSLADEQQDVKAVNKAISILDTYANDEYGTCDKKLFLAVGISKPHVPVIIPETYFLPYYVKIFHDDVFQIPFNMPVDTFPYNGVVMPPQPDPIWADFYALPPDGVANHLVKDLYPNFTEFADTLSSPPVISDTLTDEERSFFLAESKRANMVMAYLAGIRYADEQIGKLVDAIESNDKLKNNTIIVIFGDNGFSLGEKKHWTKQAMWETDTRVPLLIHTPDHSTSRIKIPVSLIDVYPTLCDLAGIDKPLFEDGSRYLDGLSLMPLFTNDTAYGNDRIILSSVGTSSGQGSCFPQYSLRSIKDHYIKYATGDADLGDCVFDSSYQETEFYEIGENREIDPNEWNNVAGEPGFDSIAQFMEEWLPGGLHYMEYIEPPLPVINYSIGFMHVFPNPASSYLQFTAFKNKGNCSIAITDLSGKNVLLEERSLLEIPVKIDVTHLHPGFYIIKIKTEEGIFSDTFIKM